MNTKILALLVIAAIAQVNSAPGLFDIFKPKETKPEVVQVENQIETPITEVISNDVAIPDAPVVEASDVIDVVPEEIKNKINTVVEEESKPASKWGLPSFNPINVMDSVTGAVEKIQEMPNKIVDTATQITEKVQEMPKTIVDTATQITEKVQEMPKTIVDTATQITEKVQEMPKTIVDTATQITDNMMDMPNKITEQVKDAASQLGSGIQDIPTNIKETVDGVVGGVTDQLTSSTENKSALETIMHNMNPKTWYDRFVQWIANKSAQAAITAPFVATKAVTDQVTGGLASKLTGA